MTFLKIFESSIKKSYKTSICSKATTFYVISSILSLIVPLLICYSSQGFWRKHDLYEEQPTVYFKHNLMLHVDTNLATKPIMWSSFDWHNSDIKKYFRPVKIEHFEEDMDKDGKNDYLAINITVPASEHEQIFSFKLLLFFQYQLFTYSRFEMESIAFIQYQSPSPGSQFIVKGDLRAYQKEALHHSGADFRYKDSLVKRNERINFNTLLEKYAARNVSTCLKNFYPLWKTGRASNQPFKIEALIYYPKETLAYQLGFWQLMKWAWIQYLSLLLISLYFCHKVKLFVFQNQVFRTIVESPIKKTL